MTKNALIYETLGNISTPEMSVTTGADGLMHLEGVFGVCGVRNRNDRVYEYNNYKKCIEELQMIIERDGGVAGEMEHPTDLNTHINNISHKVERISIDENGVVRGRIALLDTEVGKNAQALVRGGLPLFISSRGFGEEDQMGNVKLEGIVTYDLVGTPGFEQARLSLTEAKKSLCESYDPTKSYGSNICVVPMNECAGIPCEGEGCPQPDIKAMIDAAIAESIEKSDLKEAVTVELMQAYIDEVVKTYIDECYAALSDVIDNGLKDLNEEVGNINERIDTVKDKLLQKIAATSKQPSVTRHRVYLHNN